LEDEKEGCWMTKEIAASACPAFSLRTNWRKALGNQLREIQQERDCGNTHTLIRPGAVHRLIISGKKESLMGRIVTRIQKRQLLVRG